MVSIFFDLQFPPLTPNIFFYFSNHQEALFFFFFFLLLSLPSPVLQWHHEGGNFFSELFYFILLVFLPYVVSIFFDLQLPPLVLNILFCFSNHQGAVFFFFQLTSLPSSTLQLHHEKGKFSLEYDQSNWHLYVGYHFEVSSSLP